jgi:serine/threonine-protein kinase
MSPEQILGKKATPQSDIYAVGVTLYELLAGTPPLTGETTYSQMNAHVNVIPERLISVRADLPPRLSDAIARSLEKNPADRFATAEEFLLALRASQPEPTSSTAAPLPAYLQPTLLAPANTPRPTLTPQPGIANSGIANSGPAGGPPKSTTATGNLPTETVTRHLATFIGPIAKVIVSRISRQCADLDQLYLEAARQIEDSAERQRFLRTRPR